MIKLLSVYILSKSSTTSAAEFATWIRNANDNATCNARLDSATALVKNTVSVSNYSNIILYFK